MNAKKPVYIIDGTRTPFLKAKGPRGPFSASDLAVLAGRDLLARQTFSPTDIDQVIVGCVMPSENEANIGRLVALRLGCGKTVPGWTVQRNCASGMQSLDSAMKDIILGRNDLVLAGGAEAMSHAPLLLKPQMINWLARWNSAKKIGKKMQMLTKLRPAYFSPIIALLRGLSDPLFGINMGQTAERLAYQYNITREQMDAFALQSQQRATQAQAQNFFVDRNIIYDPQGKYYSADEGVRSDSSMEALAKLKPVFDRTFGRVTAGNSSQVTDGAGMLLLASEEAIKRYDLPVLGRIVDVEWAALDPTVMGLGPVMASTPLLQRHQLSLANVDYWEINEAFAAQVIACLKAWQDKDFCQTHFGLDKAFGELDQSILNVDGGAIAIGHPVGATGARIVLHLLEVLKRKKAKRGVATLCIGGGQGGAMLLETV